MGRSDFGAGLQQQQQYGNFVFLFGRLSHTSQSPLSPMPTMPPHACRHTGAMWPAFLSW